MIPPVASRPPTSPSRVANTRCQDPGLRPSDTVQTTSPGQDDGQHGERHAANPPPATAAATEFHLSLPDTVAAPPSQVSGVALAPLQPDVVLAYPRNHTAEWQLVSQTGR